MYVNIVVHAFIECVLIGLRRRRNGERQKSVDERLRSSGVRS